MQAWKVVPAAERPDLAEAALALDSQWPTFMLQDPHSRLYFNNFDAFVEWIWFLVATEDSDALLGRILTVPFRWEEDLSELPDRGWDEAIELGVETTRLGRDPNTICALEITLDPSARGKGLSSICLRHLQSITRERQLAHLVAPVRPTSKVAHCAEPMSSFLRHKGPDGFSADPWLRTHQLVGGRVIRIAPLSMTITGTFDDWFHWTGMDLRESDTAVGVAGGIVPLLVDRGNEIAVYVEPNVWVSHNTSASAS